MRVLLVGIAQEDAEHIRGSLANGEACVELTTAADLQSARRRIADAAPDIIMATPALPDGRATDIIDVCDGANCALIVVAEAQNRNVSEAVTAVRAGATDYIVKSPEVWSSLHKTVADAWRERDKVSVRRRAERLRSRLSSVLLAAPDFVGIADKGGNFLFINRAGRNMIGIDRDENVADRKIHDVFPRWSVASLINDFVLKEVPVINWTDATMKTRHSRLVRTSMAAFAHAYAGSEIKYFTIIARDVSDRENIARKLSNLEECLYQTHKLETIAHVAGGIAHNLHNAYASLVENNGWVPDGPSPMGGACGVISASDLHDRVHRLARQLFVLERWKTRDDFSQPFADAVDEAIRVVASAAPPRVEIRHSIDKECGTVTVDSSQVLQVVLNLCLNAIEALRRTGGSLELSVNRVQVGSKFAVPTTLRAGEYARMTVADNGRGIDPGIAARIFEPFFTTKTVSDGSGLGLTIVRRIARRGGGDIIVDSEPGRGAAFHVYLPLSKKNP